jgi:hypothetical protein
MCIRWSAISRQSRSTSENARGPAPGQADVDGVDAGRLEHVEDLELVLDLRVDDGRVLDPVAQRLVVELEVAVQDDPPVVAPRVPVVDELAGVVLAHGHAVSVTRGQRQW